MPIFSTSIADQHPNEVGEGVTGAGLLLTPHGTFFFSATRSTFRVYFSTFSENGSALIKRSTDVVSITDAKCVLALYGINDLARRTRSVVARQVSNLLRRALLSKLAPPRSTVDENDHIAKYSAVAFSTAIALAAPTLPSQQQTYMRHWGTDALSFHWKLAAAGDSSLQTRPLSPRTAAPPPASQTTNPAGTPP